MTIASPSPPARPAKRRYSPAEYLALEEQATERHEYRNGEIIPMAGGTTAHNSIAVNFLAFAKFGLRGQGYRPFMGDVKLWIPQPPQYTYPDVMLVKGQPEHHGEGTTIITNPQVIVEVLSRSTQAKDQTEKFRYYRSIPSFQEYILISQYDYYAEQYVKTENGKWLLGEYSGADATITLATVELSLSFQDLYEDVDFKPEASGSN